MPTKTSLPRATEAQITQLLKSLNLPLPTTSTPLSASTGAYHSIYILSFLASSPIPVPAHNETKSLVLRISGRHFPGRKTTNEIAAMSWIAANTSIPIPKVIAWDNTSENLLGNEFSLMEKAEGELLADVIDQLGKKEREGVAEQLIEMLEQLYSKPFDYVGGFQFAGKGEGKEVVSGPIVLWDFWQEWETYFPDPVAFNLGGPFEDYTEYLLAQVQKRKKEIEAHESLEEMRDLPIDALEGVIRASDEMDETRHVFAHRDMHMGNMLYSRTTGKITAILDWELAAVVPYQLWNPGNFLHDTKGRPSPGTVEFEESCVGIFERMCKERELGLVSDAGWKGRDEKVQMAVNYLGYVVYSRVRGWQAEKAAEYRRTFEELVRELETKQA